MELYGAAFGLGIVLAGILGYVLSKRPRAGTGAKTWRDTSLDDWRESRDQRAASERNRRDEPPSGPPQA